MYTTCGLTGCRAENVLVKIKFTFILFGIVKQKTIRLQKMPPALHRGARVVSFLNFFELNFVGLVAWHINIPT
jgi:hypothetical protein